MPITVHDDAVGERSLVAGNAVTITGATIGANVPDFAALPAAVATALKGRTFRYIAPTSAAGGTISNLAIVSNTLSGSNTPALTNADLRTASSRVNTTTSTANVLVGHNFTDPGMCRGAVAGVGGFFFCHRLAIVALTADAVVSIGTNNAVIGGGADPAATGNRIVLGASTGDTDLTIISTDNAATATKSAAVISKANAIIGDPTTGGPRVMEVRMYALPNDTKVHVQVLDISNGTTLFDGDITLTLPLNTTNLRPTAVLGPKSNANCQVDYIFFYGYW